MGFRKRSALKVADGRAVSPDYRRESPSIWTNDGGAPLVERERPGRGYRHILRKSDILDFIELIPDWDEVSAGLKGILLTEGDPHDFGWYFEEGVIGLCAWPRGMWLDLPHDFYDDETGVLERLGVECVRRRDCVVARFTEGQARAYMLLNIFLHELGHHHDRMTTRSRQYSARGEGFAENYALQREREIWDSYIRRFGLD